MTGLTGLVAGLALGVIVLTGLFGGEGESAATLALIGAGLAAIVLHAAAFGHLLLRRPQHGLFRNGVFLGGIGLLAVSGAVIGFAELDDAPGGVLAGLLLAMQGGAAVLAVTFPQLTAAGPSRA